MPNGARALGLDLSIDRSVIFARRLVARFSLLSAKKVTEMMRPIVVTNDDGMDNNGVR